MRITSPLHAVLLAIRMEENAIALYERIAMMTDGSIAACAKRLYGDEQSHLSRFTALLGNVPEGDDAASAELLTDAEGEGLLFPGGLTAMARQGALESCRRLMETAMDAERKSLDFYRLASENASLPEETCRIFGSIADQEAEHLSEWKERLENA